MGRARRGGRDVHGVVLLDKPRELGSNQVLQMVKRLFGARKAGHTGSLDRLASGLLPICLGEATKLSGFLLNADKRYRAGIRLGVRTATGDAEGAVVDTRPVPPLSDQAVEAALERFRGPDRADPPDALRPQAPGTTPLQAGPPGHHRGARTSPGGDSPARVHALGSGAHRPRHRMLQGNLRPDPERRHRRRPRYYRARG